jgi:hypothetical protein
MAHALGDHRDDSASENVWSRLFRAVRIQNDDELVTVSR